jgi:hypothetical protein
MMTLGGSWLALVPEIGVEGSEEASVVVAWPTTLTITDLA